jgi:hypothetical protein
VDNGYGSAEEFGAQPGVDPTTRSRPEAARPQALELAAGLVCLALRHRELVL